ncbi:MAG TPA: ATP-binding protein [Patescibacteria group bacterium]|nr:ATP-binding protein [Patescibacteria group bacterium]
MFRSARLKLTAWYLAIILCISVSFSVVIYRLLTLEFERFVHAQELRFERRFFQGNFPQFDINPPTSSFSTVDPTLVEETERRLLLSFIFLNASIGLFAGVFGYILAGRTLKPIQTMLDEQDRFITDSSHEIRTPLTALKSMLEVNLRDTNLNLPDAVQTMRESLEEVNQLQSLSDALLQLAQYKKPHSSVEFEFQKLSPLIADAVKKTNLLAKQKHISVVVHDGGVSAQVDQYSLTDLLAILLENAMKYSNENSKIQVDVKKTDHHVRLIVKDHGIGINSTDLPHIFDRFYRASTSRSTKKTGGYGLGLSIASEIVKMHHGTITAQSIQNTGTTFVINLPLRQPFARKSLLQFSLGSV